MEDDDALWDMYTTPALESVHELTDTTKKTFTMAIDVREPTEMKEHFLSMRDEHVHVVVEALDVADVIIYEHGEPLVYIERKTLSDLLASIKDGRHRNQKYRLLEQCNMNPNRIMYLYEGAVRGSPNTWYAARGRQHVSAMRTIIGAQCNTLFRDGVHVWRTGSLEETMLFLSTLLRKLQADPWMRAHWENGCAAVERTDDTEAYAHTLRMPKESKKSKRCAPRDMYLCFLAQIPGMSFARAEAVAEHFSTLVALVHTVERAGGVQELAAVNVGGRRLGTKVASRIVDSVMGHACFEHKR